MSSPRHICPVAWTGKSIVGPYEGHGHTNSPDSNFMFLNKVTYSRDLMAKDDFKNLGFQKAAEDSASSKPAGGSDVQGKGS